MTKSAGVFESDGFPPLRDRKSSLGKWPNRIKEYFRILQQFSLKSKEWLPKIPEIAEHATNLAANCQVSLSENKFHCGWIYLSQDQTERLRRSSKAAGVSLNVYLLHRINQAVQPYLQNSSFKSSWIVPVAVYSSWELALLPGVRTSTVEINIGEKDSLQDLQRQLQSEVNREAYWGFLVGAMINYVLPMSLNRAILQATIAKKNRVGTFSNIGKWTGKEDHSIWAMAPNVHPGQPLGAGAVEFNGRLGLGFKFDPCLGFDSDTTLNFLAKLLRVVFQEHT